MKKTIHTALFLNMLLLTASLGAQELSLDSCLALARRNNVDLRTSQLEIERAQAVKSQVYTKYFPQVQLGAIGYYSVNPLIHFSVEDIQSADMRAIINDLYDLVSSTGSDVRNEVSLMKHGASASAIVAQPLYAGGRIATGNRLASLGVDAALLQADVQMRDVLENIESSFYLVTGLQQKEATVSAALALIDSLEHTVQAALDNGLVTRADALQVQLKRNEIIAQRQQLLSGIRLSKMLLCRQIGIEYNENISFLDPEAAPLPPLAFDYAAQADSLRPEQQLLRLNIEAEELSKRLTLGEALPQLTLIGAAYYGNIIKNDPSANAVALLSLSIPLTAWWETSHKLRQHNIRIDEARLKQEHLSRMMTLEEEKAYSDMLDAYMLLKSDSSALEIATENYRLANLNYTAGVALLSEVLQAQALLLQAQNAITDRHTSYILARRRLLDLTTPSPASSRPSR